MRRPGFLGETHFWFGNARYPAYPRKFGGFNGFGANPCVVCEGKVCRNICTKAEQMKKIKTKHAKVRARAARTKMFTLTKGAPFSPEFAMRKGESRSQRLKRLERAKLYVSGAKMSVDYGNLVNWGTTDKLKIQRMKREQKRKVDKKNVERYGTSDMRAIVALEEERTKQRDAMWLRIYGTKDSDKVYAIPQRKRKALCDADAECVEIRERAQGKKKKVKSLLGWIF
jgi:hypothetical protein